MIASKILPPELIVKKIQKNVKVSNAIVQYSLSFIEASLDYLNIINAENIDNNKSEIVSKLITLSCFKDELSQLICSKEMLKELLKDHERMICQLRRSFEKFREREEANFIATIIDSHQSIAKKLRKCFLNKVSN
jgi:hypothetical protein